MTRGSLEERLRAAEAACAARDDFIAAVSREINNPLSPVLLAVERLRAVLATGDAAEAEQAMRLLERAAQAFAGRTRMLLDLADIMAGKRRLETLPMDLAESVRAAAARHREAARRAGCEMASSVQEGIIAMADASAIGQILDHLLSNALRFGAGRPVRVTLERVGPAQARISVQDQGPGLSETAAKNLFSLFRHPRDALQPGLGIGLWIAAQLAKGMGGTIGVDGVGGPGAHFHVILPVQAVASVAPAHQNLQTRGAPAGT